MGNANSSAKPVEMTLREKVSFGIFNSDVKFETEHDSSRLLTSIMAVLEPPTKSPVEPPSPPVAGDIVPE